MSEISKAMRQEKLMPLTLIPAQRIIPKITALNVVTV